MARRKSVITVKIRMPSHVVREMKKLIGRTVETLDVDPTVPDDVVRLIQSLKSKLGSKTRSFDLSYDESAAFMAIYDSMSSGKQSKSMATFSKYIL